MRNIIKKYLQLIIIGGAFGLIGVQFSTTIYVLCCIAAFFTGVLYDELNETIISLDNHFK